MAFVRKIKASLVKIELEDYVGEETYIFFDIVTGELRIYDGTPGGTPIFGAGGGGGINTVQDEGIDVSTAATLLNFVGAGVTVTEPGAAGELLVTISSEGTVWGDITGNIADQTDLNTALSTITSDLDTHIALTAEHIDWSVTGVEDIHADRYSGTTIGSAVGGGTPDSVLFVDDLGNLGEDNAEFNYDAITNQLIVKNLTVKNDLLNYNPDINDMGVYQTTNKLGYESDYLIAKKFYDSGFGSNDLTEEGGVRFVTVTGTGTLELYANGEWKTILAGVNIVKDADEPDIETDEFSRYILSLISGNSDALDPDGLPKVIEMKTNMGVYSTAKKINGGAF